MGDCWGWRGLGRGSVGCPPAGGPVSWAPGASLHPVVGASGPGSCPTGPRTPARCRPRSGFGVCRSRDGDAGGEGGAESGASGAFPLNPGGWGWGGRGHRPVAPEAELPARRGASVPSARRGEVFVCFSKRRLDKTLSFPRLTIFRQYVERSLVARRFTATVPFGKWVSAPCLTSLAPSLLPGPSALECGTPTRAQGLSLMCTWRCCHDFL